MSSCAPTEYTKSTGQVDAAQHQEVDVKKKLMAGILSASMLFSLAGCGSTAGSDASSSSDSGAAENSSAAESEGAEASAETTDDEEQVTLRFAWWGGDERANATIEVINQFMEANPNIKIEAEYGSSDGYSDKLSTQLASGTAADIVQVDPGVFPTFVDNGDYFLDYNEYGFDFSNFEDNYLHQRVNGYFDGKQYGIPTGIAGGDMLVNQDLADKFGIDFSQPYTYDQLLEWGQKVHEEDPEVYLICANKEFVTNMVFMNIIKQKTGVQIFDEDSLALNITEEDIQFCMDYIEKLYEYNVVQPASYSAAYSSDDLPADPNWIAGKYVAAFTYISTLNVFTAANPDANWTIGQLPVIEGALSDSWNLNCPQVLAVTSTCEHPEAAMKFLDYFFNDDTAEATLGCVRSVPPTSKAQQICVDNGTLDELLMEAATVSSTLNGMTDDKYSTSSEAKQILCDAVEALAYGTIDSAAVSADVYDQLSSYISSQQ